LMAGLLACGAERGDGGVWSSGVALRGEASNHPEVR
jgi:hypothetical protein